MSPFCIERIQSRHPKSDLPLRRYTYICRSQKMF